MIMVSLNIRSPERCFSLEMGEEEDIILQLFFQVCLAGFWREKQSNFGSGVLSAFADVDLPSSAGLFYRPSIWKGSKYGRFSTFPLSMDIFNIGFHMSWWCAGSVLLFASFCGKNGSLGSIWAASNWLFPLPLSMVMHLHLQFHICFSICQDFFCLFVFLSHWGFFKYLCMPVQWYTQDMFILMKAFILEHVQGIKMNNRGQWSSNTRLFFLIIFI